MRIRVRLFSHLRDLAGTDCLVVELPADAHVSDLLARVYKDNPKLAAADKTLLVAAGVEFVERDQPLNEAEEISLMPPVQGG